MKTKILNIAAVLILVILTNCKKTEETIAPSLSVNPTAKDIESTTGNFNIVVTSTVAWSASCDKNWIILDPMSGTGNATVKADFQENTSATSRTASIVFKGVGVEDRVVAVTQLGIQPILTVSPANLSVAADAGNAVINITSNLSWTVTSNQTWCTLAQSSGIGNAALTINYQPNTVQSQRSAIITFAANGVTNQTVQVTQAEFVPVLTVTPPNQTVNSPSGTATYNIASNISWTATCAETWCTLANPGGTNNGTLTVIYDENTTSGPRTATINVTGEGVANQSVTITQTNLIPMLSVAPSNRDVTSATGSTTFEITSNTSWTAESNQAWCTIQNTTGSGNATLNVNFEENTTTSQRIASIVIAVNGIQNEIVTITQSAMITQTWNMSDEYSNTNNPNGVWSYGRRWSADNDNVDLMSYNYNNTFWLLGSGAWSPSIGSGPNVWSDNNSNGIPCIRWTCPENGNYSLTATFTGTDSRGVDVIIYITKNGTIIFEDQIHTYNETVEFPLSNFSLQQNDHLDFSIKWSGSGTPAEYNWTSVQAIITK